MGEKKEGIDAMKNLRPKKSGGEMPREFSTARCGRQGVVGVEGEKKESE